MPLPRYQKRALLRRGGGAEQRPYSSRITLGGRRGQSLQNDAAGDRGTDGQRGPIPLEQSSQPKRERERADQKRRTSGRSKTPRDEKERREAGETRRMTDIRFHPARVTTMFVSSIR